MRLLKIIKEIKQDKRNREVAQDIFQNLLEHLRRGGETKINESTHMKDFYVEVSLEDFHFNVMSKFYSLDLRFYNRFRKQKGKLLWRGVNGSVIILNHVDFELFFQNSGIFLDDIKTKNERWETLDKMETPEFSEKVGDHLAQELETVPELKNTFFEEIHHYLDYVRTEGEIDLGNQGEYYQRDTEINAKFQSAISSFENIYLEGPISHRAEIQHGEFQEEWIEDFQKFKDWFFKNFLSKNLIENLKEDQKKRVVNRLYKFWKDKLKTE